MIADKIYFQPLVGIIVPAQNELSILAEYEKGMNYKKRFELLQSVFLVRLTGVEPALLAKIDPKSIVYANFTTGADLFFDYKDSNDSKKHIQSFSILIH